MQVILKPLGAGLLAVIIVVLCVTAFLGQKTVPAKTDKPIVLPHRSYPKEGFSVITDDPGQWNLMTPSDTMSTLTERRSADIPGGKVALVLKTKARQVRNPAHVAIQRRVSDALLKNSQLVVRFWARSAQKNRITTLFTRATSTELEIAGESKPDTDFHQEIVLTPEWKEYTLRCTLKRDYYPQTACLQFQPDISEGAYELAAITVTDFGP